MKNKCTLCCDYNWLTISRFSVINKGFDKNLPATALEAAKEELIKLRRSGEDKGKALVKK